MAPRTLALGWTLAILVACLYPATQLPDAPFDFADKVVHVLLFALLGGLWMRALPGPVHARIRPVLLGGLGYAVLTEVLQAVLPLGRFGDVSDALANALGLLLSVGLYVFVARRW